MGVITLQTRCVAKAKEQLYGTHQTLSSSVSQILEKVVHLTHDEPDISLLAGGRCYFFWAPVHLRMRHTIFLNIF